MLDPEIWKIVFEVYARHPTSAFSLAFQLIAVKQSLQQGRKGMQEALEALDLATPCRRALRDCGKSVGPCFYSHGPQTKQTGSISRKGIADS
jgi:hypothetical protein